jgi:hypothetical protein
MEADMDASENARFDGKSDIRTENTPSYRRLTPCFLFWIV